MTVGKTVLASEIIQYMKSSMASTSLHPPIPHYTTIAFVYCGNEASSTPNFHEVIGAILAQILVLKEDLLPWFDMQRLQAKQHCFKDLTNDALMKLFSEVLDLLDHTVIVLDGIDEMRSEQRQLLLNTLLTSVECVNKNRQSRLKLFISCQLLSEVKQTLRRQKNCVTHQIQVDNTKVGIRALVTKEAEKIKDKFELHKDELENDIILPVYTKVEGWSTVYFIYLHATKEM